VYIRISIYFVPKNHYIRISQKQVRTYEYTHEVLLYTGVLMSP